jgi:hypothetical protein
MVAASASQHSCEYVPAARSRDGDGLSPSLASLRVARMVADGRRRPGQFLFAQIVLIRRVRQV